MTTAYLRTNPPARSQYRSPRRNSTRPTGCTVLHTAESVMDTVGPDTGAEAVARFIVGRAEPGSYHDIADSDSSIHLVDYADEAFQDGTGSNPWALSISFALAARNWPSLSPARRAGFIAQGAVAFRRQQAWLVANGYPRTPLRRISREQSVAGVAGFITHGDRDPDRRSDPGTGFPWAEWFRACGTNNPTPPAPTVQEDDMARLVKAPDAGAAFGFNGVQRWHVEKPSVLAELIRTGVYGDGKVHTISRAALDAIPLVTP